MQVRETMLVKTWFFEREKSKTNEKASLIHVHD